MDVNRFEVLLNVVESGSFTHAAESMGYTQSAVSHIISSMEEEYGVKLLTRDRSGVRLTPEGNLLLPYAYKVVSACREFQNKVLDIRSFAAGTIRVGTFTSVAVHWLPSILNSFRALYPAIHFEIKQGNYGEIVDWILKGSIDCGFTIMPDTPGLENIFLAEDYLVLIYPPGHPIGNLEKIYPEDIGQYPFILVDEGRDPFIRNFFSGHNIPLQIECTVVDDYAVVALVESYLGISVLPSLFLLRLPYRVAQKRLETDFCRKLSISYKSNFTLSPIVKRFISHVQSWANSTELLSPRSLDRALNRETPDGEHSV